MFLLLVVLVATAVGAASIGNGFAYDDLPMIVENARVTTLLPPWDYFGQSYWPAGTLYRPLTVLLLALQWHLGDGAPWVFHATSVILLALASGLVFRLASGVLAPTWAALAGLLFAVHPVHVEAVANVVGQAELLCTVFVLASVVAAMHGVTVGFTPRRRIAVLAFGLLAALSKELGFVTPLLVLIAVGLTGTPPGSRSVRTCVPVTAAMSALLAALLLVRTAILGGFAGDAPAAPLLGLSPMARAWVSLGTVPEWGRLLLWPARLSFDYSPPGYPIFPAPGPIHLLAVILLAAAVWLAWVSRTSARAVTLGVAWTGVAILPVSNLLLPTGILLAERTLYLASVGAVLVIAGVAEHVWRRLPSAATRRAVLAVISIVLLAGALRSTARAVVWRDDNTLFAQVEGEAGGNYRAHRVRAQHLNRLGRHDDAEREYRRSIALWGHDPKVYEELAILLHGQGRDADATTVLQSGLGVAPDAPVMRSKLYYIQARHQEWQQARATAAAGLAQGDTMFMPLVRRADSALAALAQSSTSTRQ